MHIFGAEFIQVAKKEPDGIPFVLKICASEIENRALCLQVPKCMSFVIVKSEFVLLVCNSWNSFIPI
jgi:hypothetical protein